MSIWVTIKTRTKVKAGDRLQYDPPFWDKRKGETATLIGVDELHTEYKEPYWAEVLWDDPKAKNTETLRLSYFILLETPVWKDFD